MMDILLIEDDLDLAATLIDYLSLESIRCDHASNGQHGLAQVQTQHYDAVLLDLNLPRLDGLTLCRALRDQGDDIPILMITARDGLQDKLEGFHAGTDDFLVKPFAMEELIVRLQALTRRRSGQIKRFQAGDLIMDLSAHEVTRNGQSLKLSPIGWKLLEVLIRAAPEAVSKERLIAAVWGDDQPDSNTLKVHMHHLRKSVDHHFEHPMIQTLPGFGFALRADESPSTTP